jgi:hypothetical protein
MLSVEGSWQAQAETGNCVYPYTTYPYWTFPSWQAVTVSPTECSGDIHVFPCPHCNKCKCGKAAKVADA